MGAGSGGLGSAAFVYLAIDYWKDNQKGFPGAFTEWLQPVLWAGLAISALLKVPAYPHWGKERRAAPKLVVGVLFLSASLTIEACFVHFSSVLMGLDWHRSMQPLPDTGQMLLLKLDEHLPTWGKFFLRANLLGLHHYLMLFLMLAFSVLFGCVKGPGCEIGAHYCVAMAFGRLARIFTFTGTLLPSPRNWCAESRFKDMPTYPHPWAQAYHMPYVDRDTLFRLLREDIPAAITNVNPPEYHPYWGRLQFLVPILRPSPEGSGSWFQTLLRAGGGCQDLVFSGHILISTLTAMAFHAHYRGWTSWLVWLLNLHSAQREIRERHHYSVDVVLGFLSGVALWKATAPWFSQTARHALQDTPERRLLMKAAKDGDLEEIRKLVLVSDLKHASTQESGGSTVGLAIVGSCLLLGLLAFVLTRSG